MKKLVLTLLLALVAIAAAQNSEPLPMMAGGEFPVYPPLARAAQIQGVVKIVVTTDGHKVTSTRVESGHPMLVKAAETSTATWRFATHTPTTFTVTYRFVLPKKYKGNPNNPTVTLRLPNRRGGCRTAYAHPGFSRCKHRSRVMLMSNPVVP